MAEALALAGALDEAGDVGDDELGVAEAHDAEVGLQRGERVVGDLGRGRRDHRDERALARVGKADERDVGHQLELEIEPALLARLALLGEARAPGACWTGIGRCRVRPGRPWRPGSGRRRRERSARTSPSRSRTTVPSGTGTTVSSPPAPCLPLPLPCMPLPARAVRVVAEAEQRRHVVIGDQPHVAAAAAVAAVGPALGDVRLAAERHRARAAVTGFHVDLRFVDKTRHRGPV